MSTAELKKELHDCIEAADESLLNTLYEVIQASENKDDFEVSDEHKQILDERLQAYYANPNDVITLEEFKQKYGLK
jgi:low affinity Fe/Cu permease